MKNDKLKDASLFIVFVFLLSTSAAAFSLLSDISLSFGISFRDADDDHSHADETPHAEVPVPFRLYPILLQAAVRSHPFEAVIPGQIIPSLNHISRAPPLFFS